MKLVINRCCGGFEVSEAGRALYRKLSGKALPANRDQIRRNDPVLIRVVSELGHRVASGRNAHLYIVEIPDGVKWSVQEYDGSEWIAEQHRTWS